MVKQLLAPGYRRLLSDNDPTPISWNHLIVEMSRGDGYSTLSPGIQSRRYNDQDGEAYYLTLQRCMMILTHGRNYREWQRGDSQIVFVCYPQPMYASYVFQRGKTRDRCIYR